MEKREKEKVVRDATARIVYDTIVEKSKEGKVRTMSNITVYCYTEDRGADMIELGADVIISTGMTIRGGQVISDHKYFSDDVLRELKTVGINGFDSNSVLYLKRIGKPKIASLTRPVLSSKGVLLPYTHSVLAKYIGHIPRNTFQLIYEHFLATA